ncbi:beta-ketoacyl-[acyl-carrier-protein] synthase family protein [Nonomuraea longispora]|uniref:Beta-ketoacyl-[acyl-carrier-protein] synthase family protein n=1 Tax=Nonomuraea longispora TaxID=1848320 RepID=A0A4R4MY53_9ACTN|nr:beta-ketoacyl-[acyl-carrier-protein] synthase family protein [Nonomuraea longispora]TDC01155.1 beta-ketoacyl-[acyl-carrier-protein] synthase family protein [Nonomuraea longispora]
MHRVVVTGLGPVSSIGIGVAEFTTALRSGRSGISEVRSFDVSKFPRRMAGEVRGFRPEALLQVLEPERWGKASQYAAAAARLAAEDAGLDLTSIDVDRAGAVAGTTGGESQALDALAAQINSSGYAAQDPGLLDLLPSNRISHAISTELGLAGESMTIGTACSASNYAIGYAFDLLRDGEADVMFAAGADVVCRWTHAAFVRLGAMAPEACSPFDRDRPGMLTGEGGSALLLETLEHAQGRGARIYAEVLGYGVNCDAKHPVAPDAGSIAACMRAAHENADIKPSEVDYVCAHGTGTPANDAAEADALREVFGPAPPPISSIKSMLGHTMGAASGFGAIASVLAIHLGFLPPTINWSTPDPALHGIDPVPNRARAAKVRIAQNNGFAFAGNNAITMFGAPA